MSDNKFLEEKFIELNELKSMLVTYPEDYKESIIETFEKVCFQIEGYLNGIAFNKLIRINEFINIKRDNLERYNGEEGMPAYIAVNGIVYDITNSLEWKHGKFLGAKAGIDLSHSLSHENEEVLKMLAGFKVVGVIKEKGIKADKEKLKKQKPELETKIDIQLNSELETKIEPVSNSELESEIDEELKIERYLERKEHKKNRKLKGKK